MREPMSQNIPTNDSFDPSTFDNYPELYDTTLEWPYRKALELPTLKNLLGDLSDKVVIDFGCGSGVITRWLHSQGAKKVVGYDISKGMLEYAHQIENKSPLGIDYISEFDQSNFNQFDVVLAVYVIPYHTNQEDLLNTFKMVFNILKPGGKFIALPAHPEFNSEKDYYSPFGFNLIEKEPRRDASKLTLELRTPPYNDDIEAYYWTRETLNQTLNVSGFKNIEWPKLEIPENLPIELQPYANAPHAAIIQAVK